MGAADETPLRSIGNGLWNVRVPFQISLLEIGTHMSLIQLDNGNFLVIDTVVVNDQLKREIDQLTDNGTKIEAVIAVHPFHTLAYSAFYKMYPDAKYYGTPRHLRKLTEIKWTGQLDDVENKQLLTKWAPEVELRIPAGNFRRQWPYRYISHNFINFRCRIFQSPTRGHQPLYKHFCLSS